MHAYLIVGGETEKEASELIKKLKAKRIDFSLEKIADARELNRFVSFTVTAKTAIVINNFEGATEEAQNAFLKNLEEPQKNLIYILTANNTENILPTIISRVNLIEVTGEKIKVGKETIKKIEEFLASGTRERLFYITKIKTRDEAIEFLNSLISGLSVSLKENNENAFTIDNAIKTIRALKLNGNVSLQLTNFVVNQAK